MLSVLKSGFCHNTCHFSIPLFRLLEFIYKNGKLGKAPTSIDEESSSQGDVEMGIQQPSGEEQIVYHHNPMINSESSEEKQPLLRRMDDVEHKTESIEAKTESIESKTESIEAKTESIEAKTDRLEEEMRKQGKSIEEIKTMLEGMAQSL